MGSFTTIVALMVLAFAILAVAQSPFPNPPDLPGAPANVMSIPGGSLVIPMDSKQMIGSSFNIKAYGLAVHLLYNQVPILWAIKTGKQHDGIDFTAQAAQVFPSTAGATTYSYSGGPFLIDVAYQTKAKNLIAAWQSGNSGVVVHQLSGTTSVDVRHQIFQRPKALFSNLSSYVGTLTNVVKAAGLVEGTHFTVTDSSSVISNLGATSCHTLFAEPHYIYDSNAPAYYSALVSFVNSGGNFYAQCAGSNSYENYNPSSGRGGFLSKAGTTRDDDYNGFTVEYPNADTPIAQYTGVLDGDNWGHTTDWYVKPTSNIGTRKVDLAEEMTWTKNYAFYTAIDSRAQTTGPNGQTWIIQAGMKPGFTQKYGGMVFYQGSHDWSSSNEAPNRDAGKRALLNALMTPTTRNENCGFNFCPPGQTCPARDACETCQCSQAGLPVYTSIPNCCLSRSQCADCAECISNRCTSGQCDPATFGQCAECDTVAKRCVTVPCPCTTDDECLPCYGCDPAAGGGSECVELNPDCCTDNTDCGPCQFCDLDHLVTPNKRDERSLKPYFVCRAIPNCCSTAADCGPCHTCDQGQCEPLCTPCETCTAGSCSAVAGCCLVDDDCSGCSYCNLTSSTCTAAGTCPSCTTCNTGSNVCEDIPDCCSRDDQCPDCGRCAVSGNGGVCESTATGEAGACCVDDTQCDTANGYICSTFATCETACTTDSDCGSCETCQAGACIDVPSCGDGDGDGDGDNQRSDAARVESGLLF